MNNIRQTISFLWKGNQVPLSFWDDMVREHRAALVSIEVDEELGDFEIVENLPTPSEPSNSK